MLASDNCNQELIIRRAAHQEQAANTEVLRGEEGFNLAQGLLRLRLTESNNLMVLFLFLWNIS